VLPNFSVVPGRLDGASGYLVNWHVPIDDTHHWKYMILFSRKGPLDKEVERKRHHDTANAYMPIRNRSNRYLQNRESM
jgi:phthalate 4,5-dioxygenase oxygenase subunit